MATPSGDVPPSQQSTQLTFHSSHQNKKKSKNSKKKKSKKSKKSKKKKAKKSKKKVSPQSSAAALCAPASAGMGVGVAGGLLVKLAAWDSPALGVDGSAKWSGPAMDQ